mmetsp:Transcript_65880/g.142353  ORF Transcript_65880/g.142353 Transcript_65880/m.142353 type:complete len:138 (-) Transcript_65880:381-794(-)
MGNACCTNKDADKHESLEVQRKDAVGTDADFKEVIQNRSPGAAPMSKPDGTVEFKITLDKSTGTRLGVDVDHQDGCTLLIDAVTGGLMKEHNDKNPDKAVKQGDRIIEVNGVRDDVLQLVGECKKNKVLNMVVQSAK